MNWLQMMRKRQLILAQKFSSPFADSFFKDSPHSREFKRAFKKEIAEEVREILERLSWAIAKRLFFDPDFKWTKEREVALTPHWENLLQVVMIHNRKDCAGAIEVVMVERFFAWLAGDAHKLPNIGKLVSRDKEIYLVPDCRGLEQVKNFLELEAKQISEAKLRKQDKRAPGPRRQNVSFFDDMDSRTKYRDG